IGTLARKYQNEAEVIILTGDLDMLQLVDDNISVAIMRKGLCNYEVFNKINFLEKKGILPEQIVEFKGLTGDSADNYPGIRSEEHTSELQSRFDLVCRLLLEK